MRGRARRGQRMRGNRYFKPSGVNILFQGGRSLEGLEENERNEEKRRREDENSKEGKSV